jgi:hypothetical protein
MTKVNRTNKKPNIGYELRVWIHKDGLYYHLRTCPNLPDFPESGGYKEVPISRVPKKFKACPVCSENFDKSRGK